MNKLLNKNRSLKFSLAGLLFLFVAVFSINASITNHNADLKNGEVEFNTPSAAMENPGVIVDHKTPPPAVRQEIKLTTKQERLDFHKE